MSALSHHLERQVDEVKREKDAFFQRLLTHTREEAEPADVDLDVQLHPGHAADLIAASPKKPERT